MGWRNGYYYRQYWRAGTCKSEYVGSGLIARLVAELDQIDRAKLAIERLKNQAEIQEQREIDRQVESVCQQVGTITQAVLLATGHRLHKGQWRKARMKELATEDKDLAIAVLNRLQTGDGTPDDEKRFKRALVQVPQLALAWGDLGRLTIEATIKKMTNSFIFKASLEARIEQLKVEYGYGDASALERMLIEQVILCWLRLHWVEGLMNLNSDLLNQNPAQMEHMEKRLSANQRRFLRACETLARVRRLARRTPEILQLNIASQQVNQISK